MLYLPSRLLGDIGSAIFRIDMKPFTKFVLPFRRILVIGLFVIGVAVFTSPDAAKAQLSDVPSVVNTVSVINVTGAAGTQVFVEVDLESAGNAVGGGFSLNFDQTRLSISPASGNNPDVTLGSGIPGGWTLLSNGSQAASGRIGATFDGPLNAPIPVSPPNRILARFRFTILANAPAGATPITFGNVPIGRGFSDENAQDIPMTYVNGAVTVQAAAPPVTVSGRVTIPGGAGLRNALVTLTDTNNVRRVATTSSFGYYTFTNVPAGVSYTAAVASRRYAFTPVTQTISTDLTNLDFVGTGQ